MKSSREQRLFVAGIVFAAGSALHLIDHLRRGQGSVSDVLYTVGNVSLVVQVATIALVLTRHRLAPIAAASAGFSLALGFTAAHWLPRWSSISDPVWKIDSLAWFSYVASIAEILGALALALAGLAILRAGASVGDVPLAQGGGRLRRQGVGVDKILDGHGGEGGLVHE